MEEITIHTKTIQLDQFLKWVGAVGSGGEVKQLAAAGMIEVNGVTIGERRKKLQAGDVVVVRGGGGWKIAGT